MLSVFSLKSAIDEAAGGYYASNVPAYEFIGDLDESTFAEANHMIMTEAAGIAEFVGVADEALVESATNSGNMDRQYAIVENVFTQIKENFLKFIRKIKEVIKGLINKLKAFFYKFTGKTGKWLSAMKEPINKAKGRKGASEFKYTLHKWDEDLVIKKMKEASLKAIESADFNIDIVKAEVNGMKNFNKSYSGKDAQSDEVKRFVDAGEKGIERLEKDLETKKTKIMNSVGSAIGVSGKTDTADVLWRELEKAVTGGEKIEQAIYSNIEHMLTVIENSKNTISGLKDDYDKHLKQLDDLEKDVNDIDRDLSDTENTPSNVVTVIKDRINKTLTVKTSEIKFVENICNTMRSKNIKYVQTMTSEYMSALSKFAGIRDKKDK